MVDKKEEEEKEVSEKGINEERIDERLTEMLNQVEDYDVQHTLRLLIKLIFNLRYDVRQLGETIKYLAESLGQELEINNEYLAYPNVDIRKGVKRDINDLYS